MSKTVAALFLALLMIIGPGTGASLAADAAMVVDQAGAEAKYEGGAKAGTPVNLMDFLSEGDQIILTTGSSLVLNYFASGQREKISGPGRLTVKATASEPGAGLKVETSKAAAPPPETIVTAGSQQAGSVALRSSRDAGQKVTPTAGNMAKRRDQYLAQFKGANKVMPMSLFQTAVLPGKPVLSWKPVPGAAQYLVRVITPSRAWDAATDQTSLTYAGPDLVPGSKYTWTVVARSGAGDLASGGGEFWVLSSGKIQEVSQAEAKIRKTSVPDSPEVQIGLVMLCEKYELYDEATAILRTLTQKYPRNQEMVKQLKMVDPSEAM